MQYIQLDFWRLLFIRSRRMLLLSARLFEQFEVYTAWVKFLDGFLRSLALYQACVLIPRFVMNLVYVARSMQNSTFDDNLVRCCELAYDFGWIMNGVLTAFILIGPLAPLVIYLSVLTPSYQLCVHTIRFLMMYTHGKNVENNDVDLMRLVIRMGVSICMVSTGMVMLLGSANPMICFFVAFFAVVVTIVGKELTKNVASDPDLWKHRFSELSSHLSLFAQEENMHGLDLKEEEVPLVLHHKSC